MLPVKKAANYVFSLKLHGEILNYIFAAVLIIVPVRDEGYIGKECNSGCW